MRPRQIRSFLEEAERQVTDIVTHVSELKVASDQMTDSLTVMQTGMAPKLQTLQKSVDGMNDQLARLTAATDELKAVLAKHRPEE